MLAGRTQPGATPQAADPRSLCRAVSRPTSSGNHAGGQWRLLAFQAGVGAFDPRCPLQSRMHRACIRDWGCSSAGRASALQAEGHRFDPDHFHQIQYVRSSIGRAPVSKIGGCRFEAYRTCHVPSRRSQVGRRHLIAIQVAKARTRSNRVVESINPCARSSAGQSAAVRRPRPAIRLRPGAPPTTHSSIAQLVEAPGC